MTLPNLVRTPDHPQTFPGRNAALALDQYDMGCQFHEIKHKRDAGVVDTTGFGATVEYALAAVQKASLEAKGFYAPGAQMDEIYVPRLGQGRDIYLAYGPLGWDLGNPAVLQPSVLTKYDTDVKVKGGVELNVTAMARGFIDDGVIMLSPNAYTTATVTSPVLDNTAYGAEGTPGWNSDGSSVAGGAAELRVFSATGTTPTLACKVQQSTDLGTTWTDVPGWTFATVTTYNNVQRLNLPKQQSLGAQLRTVSTVTGTNPVITALLVVARGVKIT